MFTIKLATQSDLPALKNIMQECRASVTVGNPITDELWGLSIRGNLVHMLTDGLTPVGFWLGGPDNHRSELNIGLIAIRKAYQGQNLGQMLVSDIKTSTLDHGLDYAMLKVPESRCLPNHDDYALPWLKKMGFVANGVVDRKVYHHNREMYDIYEFTVEAWARQIWTLWATEDGGFQVRDINGNEVVTCNDIRTAISTAKRYGQLKGLSINIIEGVSE